MTAERYLWIGIGCQRGTSQKFIEAAVKHVFQENNLPDAIAGVATIDTKASEVGLIKFCCCYDLPLICFPAEDLQNVTVPNPSNLVASKVKTLSVAEAAAILAVSYNTFALQENCRGILLISKQVIRSVQDLTGAVTIAVAG